MLAFSILYNHRRLFHKLLYNAVIAYSKLLSFGEGVRMKKGYFRNSITPTILIMLVILSTITCVTPSVQAEAGGTGKFLEINFITTNEADLFDSNCKVTATKVSSDQTFTYVASDSSSYSQKVGAGTVLLEAIPDTANGWEFSHFVIRDEIQQNPSEYKAEKYDVVDAVFIKQPITFDIEVFVTAGLGEVWYNGSFIADQDNDEYNSVIITVNYGDTPRFAFVPSETYHLSSVLIDNSFYANLTLTEFTQSYQYPPIEEEGFYGLAVAFSIDGEAIIPAGNDITVFLSSAASLNFNSVGDGIAFGNEIYSFADVIIWNITVATFNLGDQTLIALRYDPSRIIGAEEDLRLYRSNSEYADLYYTCDFNDDGAVNGQDVAIIANIVKHPKFWDPEENSEFDLNNDDAVTEEDVHIVNSMKNLDLEWIDITYDVDTLNNILYGVTDHFSIFRGR